MILFIEDFESIDEDKDGIATKDELTSICALDRSLPPTQEEAEDCYQDTRKNMDVNGDGDINLYEFVFSLTLNGLKNVHFHETDGLEKILRFVKRTLSAPCNNKECE